MRDDDAAPGRRGPAAARGLDNQVLLQTNFIAERLERRHRARRLVRLGAWLGVLGGILLLFPPLIINDLASQRAGRLLRVKTAREQVAEQAAEHDRLIAEMQRLDYTRRIAVGVHANNAQWLDLARELRDRLPAGLWYTRLQVLAASAEPAADGTVRQRLLLTGRAERHQAIGELVTALLQSPWIEVAVLRRSGPVKELTGPFEFEIEGRLRRPIGNLVSQPATPGAGR